ncbi:hypothetical protein BD779DRAFT_1525886 [Infundibulicybe gibba]|nr:hypothetical protein BD779DRAFT_1525886 [Infundibulicybe gibba]
MWVHSESLVSSPSLEILLLYSFHACSINNRSPFCSAMLNPLVMVLAGLFNIAWAAGVVRNVTIDDGLRDPNFGAKILYSPQEAWIAQGICKACETNPDPAQAHSGTWHIGGDRPDLSNISITASTQFYGFAVFVFCIVPPTTSSNAVPSTVHFLIDSHQTGIFTSSPTTSFQYDVLAFAYHSPSSTDHTLTIQPADGSELTPFFLDYIIYSYDSTQGSQQPSPSSPSPPSSSHQNNKLKIIGGVLGTVILLLAIFVAFLLYRIRQQRGRVFAGFISKPSPQGSKSGPGSGRLHFRPSLLGVTRFRHSTAPVQEPYPQTYPPPKGPIETIPPLALDAVSEHNLPLPPPLAGTLPQGNDLQARPDHSLDISASSEFIAPITHTPGQRLYIVTNM